MADPKSSLDNATYGERMTALLIGLFLISVIASEFLNYLESLGFGTVGSLWATIVDYFLVEIWPKWQLFAALLSFFAIVGIIYCYRQLAIIDREEAKIYGDVPESSVLEKMEAIEEIVEPKPENEQWKKVMSYLHSNNPSEWRLAVIEADAMLEMLLRTLGYPGDSVGEMLKGANKNEFVTLDDAWEAHKARNAIAHARPGFQLTEREAKRVIALFEKVFKEFQII